MENRYHYELIWDTAEGRDSRHLICTNEEFERQATAIYKDCQNNGTPIYGMTSRKIGNFAAPDARNVLIAYAGSSLSHQTYHFTGTEADIAAEIEWLKESGAGYVKYELADPEPPVLHPDRIKAVRAMETLARCVNDETVFNLWLTLGVADGDIDENTTDEEIEDYCDNDADFADLMDTFLRLMSRAYKSGGLFCDGVTSKEDL